MWSIRGWACKEPAQSNDMLRRARAADGSRPGAFRAAAAAFQRHDSQRNRYRVLPGVRRRAAPVCGSQLLPVLRARALARALESGKEEVSSMLPLANSVEGVPHSRIRELA